MDHLPGEIHTAAIRRERRNPVRIEGQKGSSLL
jgi:hypothetical protein